MTAAPRTWAAELLHFWFETLSPRDWFRGNPALDQTFERRFASDWEKLSAEAPLSFLNDPKTALAAVLLFDQVPRNIFRGSAQSFTTDPLARQISRGASARGFASRLSSDSQRQFLAMPLMHSEDIADQRQSLAIYRQLGLRYGLPFARSHHAMIARFGRFPHRNEVLGRKSSAAEQHAVAEGFAW